MSTSTLQETATRLDDRNIIEQVPVKPDRATLIAAITEDAGVSADFAEHFVNWVINSVRVMRKHGYTQKYLTDGEWVRYHHVLDTIAPDDQVSEPGSTHAMLESYVLDDSRAELGLMHTNDADGEPQYCQVHVRLSIAR